MLSIEYLPTDSLTPYNGNAKEHSREQVQQIAESIRLFGFADPVAVWGDENTVVEGHGRLMAAKMLGIKEIPVIRLDGLTDEQRRAYTLIHNQLTMNSGFNLDMLNLELENISEIEMGTFDFTVDADSVFSIDNFESVNGYSEEASDKETFNITLTFPAKYKAAVSKYMRKHKSEIVQNIVKRSEEQ